MTGHRSNGYEAAALAFAAARSDTGIALVNRWAAALPRGASVLDIGAGTGWPVGEALVAAGLDVRAIEPSPTLAAALRKQCPAAKIACEPFEKSTFFGRRFDAVLAVGVIFLLREDEQCRLIARAAGALKPNGRLLLTAPEARCSWHDVLTGQLSRSLGGNRYRRELTRNGLQPMAVREDRGGNKYLEARKVARSGRAFVSDIGRVANGRRF